MRRLLKIKRGPWEKIQKPLIPQMTMEFGSRFCHPEPGPELNSGSNDFGISVLGLENLGFKAPPLGGVLYFIVFLIGVILILIAVIRDFWTFSEISKKILDKCSFFNYLY